MTLIIMATLWTFTVGVGVGGSAVLASLPKPLRDAWFARMRSLVRTRAR